MAEKRKAVVFDRDPFGDNRSMETMTKLADADLALVVKGDEAKIIKLRWAEPEDYEVEMVRP